MDGGKERGKGALIMVEQRRRENSARSRVAKFRGYHIVLLYIFTFFSRIQTPRFPDK